MSAAGPEFDAELQANLRKVRVPCQGQKIYKDECIYSFDNPESATGLYICLNTFRGIGEAHLQRHFESTNGDGAVFLHIKRIKKKIENTADSAPDGPDKKITRLAIGVEGGFFPDLSKKKFEFEDTLSIFLFPSKKSCPWPDTNLPELLKQSVNAILEADSASKLEELEALSGAWDGEALVVSKFAENLEQLDNGIKVPPTGWKCEKCDLTQNLWLNLTDGSILCGRKYFDGSGGNDHAVEHYRDKGHPLAVKLGTITKEGKADVYSYKEDDMVIDPYLAKHLAHFGINIGNMEKTERTMAELELEANQKYGEWSVLTESGSKLQPLGGPGLVGLSNLGNSCYMNCVMQVLFTIPDFRSKFLEQRQAIFDDLVRNSANPVEDFNCQMAKLAEGLLTDKYAVQPVADETTSDITFEGIKPQMFKTLMGKGHPDFASKRQQDAQEYFLHIVNLLERSSHNHVNPADCFKFKVEDRFECSQSHKVKYTYRTEYCLPLPIPESAATNKDDVAAYEAKKKQAEEAGQRYEGEVIRPHIKFDSCLESFSQSETIEQFYSTAINDKTTAIKSTRLSTFPDYLLLHLKKFTLNEDWTPRKLDVAVEMPDVLDLARVRGKGLQPNEETLQDIEGAPPAINLDEGVISQLMEMGFPLEACKKAVFFTDNQGLEPATEWLMQHVGDSDFSDPFVPPGTQATGGNSDFVPDEEAVAMILSLGFSRAQAVKALKETNNSIERAADWVFSHQQELMELDTAPNEAQAPLAAPEFRDGSEKYQLVAFISHMGTSTMVGHYVCHILQNGRWVLFNDEKVALSEHPPKELGYLYLYKRIN
ncbi:ubiquitin carboxyl-terminal hydrolase 5 [Neocloeon triangulifer]|uniref:ubiquitin carboxyl-terminal hydrolase 5 n=1 Tax=Neocloeon triangulifer TaxID=2078957 RepID=UPI00286F3AD7|nr:ubiquitin carboxyl-terminal hydrolase 5 [Neocloeon triangulifer]